METLTHISTDEAAARLGVSASRIKQWIAEGRLPAIQISRLWRVPLATCRRPKARRRGPKPRE